MTNNQEKTCWHCGAAIPFTPQPGGHCWKCGAVQSRVEPNSIGGACGKLSVKTQDEFVLVKQKGRFGPAKTILKLDPFVARFLGELLVNWFGSINDVLPIPDKMTDSPTNLSHRDFGLIFLLDVYG